MISDNEKRTTYLPYEEYKKLNEFDDFVELQYVLGLQTCKSKSDVVELLKDYRKNILKEILDKAKQTEDKLCCIFAGGDDPEPCSYSLKRLEEILFKDMSLTKVQKDILDYLFFVKKRCSKSRISKGIGKSIGCTYRNILELEKKGFVLRRHVKKGVNFRERWCLNTEIYETLKGQDYNRD